MQTAAQATAELRRRDHAHVWHPFTQQQGWMDEDAPIIVSGDGNELIDSDGNRWLDATSALWCNVHGHRHPAIDAAVTEQLGRVAHTTMLGLAHPPSIELAEQLVRIAPGDGLTRVFYSESGATSTEIALKMAYQSQLQRGKPEKTRFAYLESSYHGDTLGAVSVGGIELFHSRFRPLLFDGVRLPFGDLAAAEALISAHAHELAGLIAEPVVQGAAGMLIQPDGYLRGLRELCTAHDVLLIVDEVATGFGRTGTMFASEQEGVDADLLCVAKGLTGGYLPLAATLATEEIYESFLGAHESFRTFFHGHTFTGNPLACAAALASIQLFESEQVLQRVQARAELFAALLAAQVAPLAQVAEIRQRGLMVGIELVEQPLSARAGHQVTLAARERGVIARPLGDVIALMPPLSITAAEIERLVAVIAESIAAAVPA